jgi:hypothetical protein
MQMFEVDSKLNQAAKALAWPEVCVLATQLGKFIVIIRGSQRLTLSVQVELSHLSKPRKHSEVAHLPRLRL